MIGDDVLLGRRLPDRADLVVRGVEAAVCGTSPGMLPSAPAQAPRRGGRDLRKGKVAGARALVGQVGAHGRCFVARRLRPAPPAGKSAACAVGGLTLPGSALPGPLV